MSSLKDRLGALGVQKPSPSTGQPMSAPAHPIEQVVAGRTEDTPHGPIFVAQQDHPADTVHGCASLRISAPLEAIAQWAQVPEDTFADPSRLGFLDAETTGLARGTGTYGFLLGAARYDGDTFQVRQFFLHDPTEEPAQLAALESYLSSCTALVTFNGKTFDLPLLRTRYIVNGLDFLFADLPHLDLLSLARRLWHSRLPSRSLGTLEREILHLPRTDEDVPGWMIPELYFDYLDDRDARPLAGVFYHNAIDVLSMAALLQHAAALLSDPLSSDVPAPDRADMGRWFEDLGQVDLAAQLYEQALVGDLPAPIRSWVVRRWSHLEKQRDDLEAAKRLWHEAAANGEIYAHVELAKVYEHREGNYAGALFWTQLALDKIGEPGMPPEERLRWADELAHRLERLQRKSEQIS